MNCGSDQNELSTSTSTADNAQEKNQRTIEESTYLSPVISEHYSRLFVTTLFIALKERPLADFSGLVDLQKKHGLIYRYNGKHLAG